MLDPRFNMMVQDPLFLKELAGITPIEELEGALRLFEEIEAFEMCATIKSVLDERAALQG